MIVRIQAAEAAIDDADAERDRRRAVTHGWVSVGFDPGGDKRTALNRLAYRAERAFAKALGVELRRDPDGFRAPDVAGYSVRFASRPGYGLVIHNRDGPYPYALVCATADPLTFEIVGTLGRAAALELRAGGIGMALPGTTDAWVIPREYVAATGSNPEGT